jgi:cation diffusion facilitator CzcD-associated flavoprotein CzcO
MGKISERDLRSHSLIHSPRFSLRSGAIVQPSHLDVIIVGAGLSGIGAAYHLQTQCPGKTYAILEARDRLGGTWDLFRYPGIRSDSDMYTLGYSFRPWTHAKSIADGATILNYLRDTAETHGIDRQIRFNHKIVGAKWSSAAGRWTLEATGAAGETLQLTCNFLFVCAGYYDYEAGYTPEFPGRDRFRGSIVHPQHWSAETDYEGKRVVVIGSGATAVTLVPELARKAAHVTMLQRSPTYVVSAPARDRIADWLRERVSSQSAYAITRWKNVMFGMAFYNYCQRQPERAKKLLVGMVRRQVRDSPELTAHFTPTYKPWDQRMCLVPDGDLFRAIRHGKASVVTDRIDAFVENGIRLRSGETLEADLIVTATGLNLKFLGGVQVEVDGKPVPPAKTMAYKGMMFSDVPNLALAAGYTNASWTLKVDLTCEYVCRLLNYMDANGYKSCVPRKNDPRLKEEPFIRFSSGYIQRSIDKFPRHGNRAPWRVRQNYAYDRVTLRRARVDDGVMQFA